METIQKPDARSGTRIPGVTILLLLLLWSEHFTRALVFEQSLKYTVQSHQL
jgi:hypothetical protein